MRIGNRSYGSLAADLGLEIEGEALSVLHCAADGSKLIVRRTADGQFAAIKVHGIYAKILKILPTLDRARAYNFAVAKA